MGVELTVEQAERWISDNLRSRGLNNYFVCTVREVPSREEYLDIRRSCDGLECKTIFRVYADRGSATFMRNSLTLLPSQRNRETKQVKEILEALGFDVQKSYYSVPHT